MAGFLLSLKKRKVESPARKAAPAPALASRSDDESDPESKIVNITSFDGSTSTEGGDTTQKPPLVIKQAKLVKLIPKKPQTVTRPPSGALLKHGINTFEPISNTVSEPEAQPQLLPDAEARRSLLAGESDPRTDALVIEALSEGEDTHSSDEDSDQYARVPVEQFGAAMLRGMGWKPLHKDNTKKVLVEKRQRGPLLGIGAVGVESSVMSELNGPRGAKLSIPTLRRNRATGEIIRESKEGVPKS